MRITKALLLASVVLLFSSCSDTLYSWYNSEEAFYVYQKKNTDKAFDTTLKEYKRVIDGQKSERPVVPPGVMAEYGYLLYQSGQEAKGITYLKKEIALYPESEIFIGRILKQIEK